jgi:predicted CopG family antitoxin
VRSAMTSSGNSTFDAYKSDTLRRLEDEQRNFEEFLKRLRDAKDKAEFDTFMEDRASRSAETSEDDAAKPA